MNEKHLSDTKSLGKMLDPSSIDKLTTFTHYLLDWFNINGRKLPWRETRDPYRILISEIMLQQTNVSIVIPIYKDFLRRFPTIHHLAEVSIESVREITDQLGYTRRGVYLHNIAKQIVSEKNGEFPNTLEDLLSLKGIGRYTAGAILSFAFEKEDSSSAIVDVNVDRVFSRIFGYWDRERDSSYEKLMWSIAEAYVASGNVWKKNQSIMDLGAMLCVATKPKCYICPMTSICEYFRKVIPKIKPLDSFFT